MSILTMQGITLSVDAPAGLLTVLRDITLEIEQGEKVGIIGPSGSGKTSLLMIIAGLEKASSGSCCVAGRELTELDEDERALLRREHIGIVFQAFHLISTMNALENVAVPLEIAGHSDPFEAARKALHAVGLEQRQTHYPGTLSGGEQQRVALARALAPRPGLLLADEPTGNLDEATGDIITSLLLDESTRSQASLLLVTHDHELARRCDRVIKLRDGYIDSSPGRE